MEATQPRNPPPGILIDTDYANVFIQSYLDYSRLTWIKCASEELTCLNWSFQFFQPVSFRKLPCAVVACAVDKYLIGDLKWHNAPPI